jgi:hypothetical protein
VQKHRRCLRRIAWLFPVIASLEADRSADRRVILRVAFTQFGGGTGEVGAKAAGFNDRDLDAERSDLFGQRL